MALSGLAEAMGPIGECKIAGEDCPPATAEPLAVRLGSAVSRGSFDEVTHRRPAREVPVASRKEVTTTTELTPTSTVTTTRTGAGLAEDTMTLSSLGTSAQSSSTVATVAMATTTATSARPATSTTTETQPYDNEHHSRANNSTSSTVGPTTTAGTFLPTTSTTRGPLDGPPGAPGVPG